MSLSLQDPTLARRRFFHAVSVQEQAANYQLAMTFFSWLMQQGGKPNLQVVEFDKLSSSEVVIADVPCTLMALILYKETATATYVKATDSATTSSDDGSEYRTKISGADNIQGLFFPKGAAFANGITMQGNTTATGGTGSGADGASGVALLAAA